ncbi:hypothetical protein M758_UG148800 [Ceratodon purpureus]|nr:hypothetical protein M758_UG148800 [Ceratodon purpureus]
MDDGVEAGWKVVLRHEPRSRRMTEEKDLPEFESAGTMYPLPNGAVTVEDTSMDGETEAQTEAEVVDAGRVRQVDDVLAHVDEEEFQDDNDYEDEVALEYVE